MIPAPGYVRLLSHHGSDAQIDAHARVSTGTEADPRTPEKVRGLLRYMMRHRHTSPFEFAGMTFQISAPVFVARQWMRHRTASISEISGRYTESSGGAYVPSVWHGKPADNKQGAGAPLDRDGQDYCADVAAISVADAEDGYRLLLSAGAAPEEARTLLPLGTYTRWDWQMDLHNLLHFVSLRLDPHAQGLTRCYAAAIAEYIAQVFPLTWEAFKDYRLHAVSLSRMEAEAIRAMLRGEAPDLSQMSAREQREFQAVWGAGSPVAPPPAP